MSEELKAYATTVENCELFRAELAAIKAPARDITAAVDAAMIEMANISPPMRRNECERLIRAALNGAPVRQVSVPVSGVPSIKCWSCKQTVSLDDRVDADGNCPHCRVELDLEEYLRAMLAAAPAAPAADALVEALEHARLFIVNGIDLGFIQMPEAGTPDPAHETLPMIEAALAAHRSKGGV